MSYYPIHENPNFDVDKHVSSMRKALQMKDKPKIIKLIVGINNAQRQKFKRAFKAQCGATLEDLLKNIFSGDSMASFDALLTTPIEYDASQLFASMKGLGTNENTLIEIICSRTPQQLRVLKEHFDQVHKEGLAEKVKGDTSAEFQSLMVGLVNGSKDSGTDTDDTKAFSDAHRLYADGKGNFKKGETGSHFLLILGRQNIYQLRKVFEEYQKLAKASIFDGIDKDCCGILGKRTDLQDAYTAIALCSIDKQEFFARQLKRSMKGAGTWDNDLIRAVVTRSEVDLHLIEDTYEKIFKKTLVKDIKGDTSGSYEQILLAICKGNNNLSFEY